MNGTVSRDGVSSEHTLAEIRESSVNTASITEVHNTHALTATGLQHYTIDGCPVAFAPQIQAFKLSRRLYVHPAPAWNHRFSQAV